MVEVDASRVPQLPSQLADGAGLAAAILRRYAHHAPQSRAQFGHFSWKLSADLPCGPKPWRRRDLERGLAYRTDRHGTESGRTRRRHSCAHVSRSPQRHVCRAQRRHGDPGSHARRSATAARLQLSRTRLALAQTQPAARRDDSMAPDGRAAHRARLRLRTCLPGSGAVMLARSLRRRHQERWGAPSDHMQWMNPTRVPWSCCSKRLPSCSHCSTNSAATFHRRARVMARPARPRPPHPNRPTASLTDAAGSGDRWRLPCELIEPQYRP